MKFSRTILFFLLGFFVAQTVWYYPNLPEQVAVHFNVFGEPDRWTAKFGFLIFDALILLFIIAEFTLLPFLIEKSPNTILNLPNKEYWLADERRARTFAFIRNYLEWFAVGLLALFIGINQLVYRANLNRENLSPESWLIIGAFLIFTILWMIKFVKQFKVKL